MILRKKMNIICGHYGCGKTNLSLNLAVDCARAGEPVTLVDLDLVNPYFRSSDYASKLKEENIQVIAPVYAGSNVDIPSLPAEIYSIFDTDRTVILDVGGDDVGATVLGRFQEKLNRMEYDLFYVVNRYRNLTVTAEEAVQILKEIEAVSRCRATALINNSHLKGETTVDTVLASLKFSEETARLLSLPVYCVTIPEWLYPEYCGRKEAQDSPGQLYPVKLYVTQLTED